MRNMKWVLLLLVAAAIGVGCSDSDSDLPSGTYEGTIKKVNADEKEIYVEVEHEGQKKEAELYFTDDTELGGAAAAAGFEMLKEGMKVEITVERKDDRLVPIKVVPKM